MRDSGLTPGEVITQLHQMARRQVDLAEEGQWTELTQVLRKRRGLIESTDLTLNCTTEKLVFLCRQILTLDQRTLRILKEAQRRILKQTSRLQKQRLTVRAYRRSSQRPSQPPQHLDEKK